MKNKIKRKRKSKKKIKNNSFLFYGLFLCAFSLPFIVGYEYMKDNKTNLNKNHNTNKAENDKKIKIVIVPGHKNRNGGTSFGDVKEAEMNLDLSINLVEFLKNEEKFEIIMPWDQNGYNPIFADYFKKEKKSIEDFINSKKKIMSKLVRTGEVKKADGVVHNNVSPETSLELYGINKWANENNVDAIIHIHFNDYPNRGYGLQGKYSGFAIYVPEKQYSNAGSSKKMAESIFNQLEKFYPKSNFLLEQEGIIEDQKLIAIGANDTLGSAGLLIEYGYIYEPQFLNEKIRKSVLRDLAFQTYIGITKFFETDKNLSFKYDTSFIPHKWEDFLEKGVKNNESILALQTALIFEKLYPPEGFDKHECPMTGNFSNCTLLALKKFQDKYGIRDENGRLGESTKNKLNELYSY